MSPYTESGWHEANQRYLMATLAGVREALERYAALRGAGELKDTHQTRRGRLPNALRMATQESQRQAQDQLSAPAALDNLCTIFSLSPFERDLLLLCGGVDLDSSFTELCARAHNDPGRTYPTFGLALAALQEPHWDAITPAGPLRRWRLIEVGAGPSLTSSPLRIDERVLHYLTGINYLDERLQDFVEPLDQFTELPPSQLKLSHRVIEAWAHDGDGYQWPIIQLNGEEHTSKLAIVASACAEMELNGHIVRSQNLPVTVAERQSFARLWEREAVLGHRVLLIDCEHGDAVLNSTVIQSFIESIRGRIVLSIRDPLPGQFHHVIHLETRKPDSREQYVLWEDNLGPLAKKLDGELQALVNCFNLGTADIGSVSAEVLAGSAAAESPIAIASALSRACRRQARPRMDNLAQRIEPAAHWQDLVLPEPQHQLLRNICGHVRQRIKVYETWSLATKCKRGLGISALFAGASGTGKTMAAEVLARELDLDLYRIDLSAVVSKYIGETEKNLRRVFDAAEESGAILLFDEADALFGKRSEVKDSHDRYANIEISYLLQRMESYRGLAILTTNMKNAVDTAFLRRIRFIVQFSFPDAAQRAEIWRRVYPIDTPTEGLDISKLARLNITGGTIRNIAMNGAFLAADADDPVGMSHLLRATRVEYAKLEKPLTDKEIAGWI